MKECTVSEQTSILKTIRRMLGPDEDYEYFDQDLIIHINAAFSRLCQIGVGMDTPFKIHGTEEEWTDFIGDGYFEEVKQYVYLSVKLIFDPPSSGSVLSAYKEKLQELEWFLREVNETGY